MIFRTGPGRGGRSLWDLLDGPEGAVPGLLRRILYDITIVVVVIVIISLCTMHFDDGLDRAMDRSHVG